MAIPDYQAIMKPLLEMVKDNQEHYIRDLYDKLADYFNLNPQERSELLPSGNQSTFENRVGWARTYMKEAGLLKSVKRGYIRITPRGIDVLQKNPKIINDKYLEQFSEFKAFKTRKRKKDPGQEKAIEKKTPIELINEGYQQIVESLSTDLLELVKKMRPSDFERLVVQVLVDMGYGGSFKDAQKVLGKVGDDGIDGIIKEDRLGFDVIYIQAKKWADTTIGGPEIQGFIGALETKGANKGVFITTSRFSQKAVENAKKTHTKKIVLIDGERLTQFMIDLGIGVSEVETYTIKRVDADYFENI